MKYFHKIDGIELKKDIYSEQFAESADIKSNFMVFINSDCIDEDEDKKALAKRLLAYSKRLEKMARFLGRK